MKYSRTNHASRPIAASGAVPQRRTSSNNRAKRVSP